MKILLSNDDGIYAFGLKILYHLLSETKHEIVICAPHRQHSGSSHSITLSTPLLAHKIQQNNQFYGIAIDGTPSDSVKLGLSQFCSDADMVVSGINLGPNAGPSVYYSGTVAAAFEGAMQGKTSLAFSFESFHENDMYGLEEKLHPFMPKLLDICHERILYNINVPHVPEIKGIKITRQFRGFFDDEYEKRLNPLNREYFWLKDITFTSESARVTSMQGKYCHDWEAVRQGYISVTPLQFDLTDYQRIEELERKLQA